MPSDRMSTDLQEHGRRLHPFTLLFSTVGIARHLVIPAIFGGISAADGNASRAASIIVGVLVVPSLAIAIANYLSFRYAIRGEELIYRSGVLRRKQRVIPLARVQNIEVRQSLVQRLTGVAEVRVETAGTGSEPEAGLSVVSVKEANELRAELLSRRAPPRTGEDVAGVATAEEAATETTLVHLTPPELAMAGATANEAGLIAAALVGALQFADDLPIPFERYIPDVERYFIDQSVAGTILVVAIFTLGLIVIGWVFSVVGSVVGYYDFRLTRVGDDLHKTYGLLSRREANVPLRRVQAIRVEESLLRRPLKLASLKIETAGSPIQQQQQGGAEAFVPIAHARQVPALVRALFTDFALEGVSFLPVHPRSRRRTTTRYAIAILVLAGAGAILDLRALWLLVLLPLAWALAAWQYRMRGYAVTEDYVVLRSGVLNRITWIVPDDKIQTLHLTSTPFQRRHRLASLIVDTASGGSQPTLIDVGIAEAERLMGEMAERARAARARRRAEQRARRRSLLPSPEPAS